MKKLILGAALVAFAPMALADNGPGCGPGAQLWKGQTGLFAHTSAGTTNGTFSSPLFGILSGTSGCEDPGVVSNEHQKKVFVSMNLDDLAQDAARGNGDHISSLADLMGIDAVDQGAFFKLAQVNYESIFAAEGADYNHVLDALNSAVMQDAQLAHYITNS